MSFEPPKVLLIDDDQDTLRVLRRILEAEGYASRSTTSTEEALQLLAEEDYVAVLCDLWMPVLSGRDFYMKLKEDLPQYRNRFIVVTGDVASEYAWDFIEERHLPYVLKPFNVPLLMRTLSEVVGDRKPKEPEEDSAVEKRVNRRTTLKASVRIRKKKFATGAPDVATTVNFSKDGVLFVSDQNYRAGTEVWVVFPYSRDLEGPEQDGYVVRVEEREDGKRQVAVALGKAAEKSRQGPQAPPSERRSRHIEKLSPWSDDDALGSRSFSEAEELKERIAQEREEIRRLADDLADLKENYHKVTAERDRLARDEVSLSSQLKELSTAKSSTSDTIENLTRQMESLEGQLTQHEQYRYQATHDNLTGMWNRAAIFDILEQELARAQRDNRSVGVIIADLDHFKRVNDTYGHMAGDVVLKEAARRFTASLRDYDSVGRYGGEEFLLVLPGCDAQNALNQAERVRAAIAGGPVSAEEQQIPITVSLGVAAANDPAAMEATIRVADGALYRAKRAGRNRALLADSGSPDGGMGGGHGGGEPLSESPKASSSWTAGTPRIPPAS